MTKNQDLRYIRTNQMLCDAFTELLSKKKFENITINDLCEKALIRRATFYTHFMDKYDFFTYFIRQNRNQFLSTWKTSESQQTLKDFSIHMFRQLINYLSEHMDMVHNIFNSSALSILMDLLADEIRTSFLNKLKEVPASDKKPEPLMEITAVYCSGGIIQLLRYWLTTTNDISQEQLINQYELLINGSGLSNL